MFCSKNISADVGETAEVSNNIHWKGGFTDLYRGILAWRIWASLGMRDIHLRYKRTFLGPLWISMSTIATMVTMSLVFSSIFKDDITTFLPYLSAGMIVWGLMSSSCIEAPGIFINSQHLINSTTLHLTIYALRNSTRNLVIFFHNIALFMIVYIPYSGNLTPATSILLLTIPLLFFAIMFSGIILAIIGTRFRDIGPIMTVGMQLLFFITPVFWAPEHIGGRKYWIWANPIYHLLEMVRAPMLGKVPTMLSAQMSLGFTLILGLIAFGLLSRFRHRIIYWL
jgi:ABC-type polysaccharide/polyol phosphate export permease